MPNNRGVSPARKRTEKRGKEKMPPPEGRHMPSSVFSCGSCHKMTRVAHPNGKPPKTFICIHCDTGQRVERRLTADYTPGHNATGHRVGW